MSVPVESNDDRRHSARCQCSIVASSGPLDDAEEWSGKVEEISETGLRLLMERRFEPGTTLKVVLRRTDGGLLGAVEARIMHVAAADDQWRHGCEIIGEL